MKEYSSIKVKTYEVALPIIRGWMVYEVEAESEEEAKEIVANGECDTLSDSEYDNVECDLDINSWEVGEI